MSSSPRQDLPPLHRACSLGDLDTLKTLVESKHDLCETAFGRTPLHYAAMRGHLKVAALLIDKIPSAAIDTLDEHGSTALQLAAIHGHLALAKALFLAGANACLRDNDGWSLLHAATFSGDAALVRWVLRLPKDRVPESLLDAPDMDGSPPLMFAILNQCHDAIHALIEAGADIHQQGEDGGCVLASACEEGDHSMILLLLEAGADPVTLDTSLWECPESVVSEFSSRLSALVEEHLIRDLSNMVLAYLWPVPAEEDLDLALDPHQLLDALDEDSADGSLDNIE